MTTKQSKNQKKSVIIPSSDVIKEVPLSLIDIDNYRKSFSQDAILELADNIKIHGVMQAVLVRPTKNGRYGLVYGERRFRASEIVGFETIKASIKELTDEQVLDIQLSENLQREDVSPLEEANAFMRYLDLGKDIAEISIKVGKSASFVAGRLSLNKLIQPFKDMLLNDTLSLKQAIYLARFDLEIQDRYLGVSGGRIGSFKELQSFFEQRFEMPLSKACFPLTKEDLLPNVSDCNGCAKNSSCNLLLFSDKKEATCLDKLCFKAKTNAWNLIEVISLPDDICIVEGYSYDMSSDDRNLITNLSNASINVYPRYIISKILIEPKFDISVPLLEDYENEDDYQESLSDYNEELSEHNIELGDYKSDLESPNFRKGFFVSGSSRLRHFQFLINDSIPSPGESNSESNTKSHLSELKEMKEVLIKKMARGLELDEEKIHKKRIDSLKTINQYSIDQDSESVLNEDENNAVLICLYNQMGWNSRLAFETKFNIKGTGEKKYLQIINLSESTKAYMIRQTIQQLLFNVYINDITHAASSKIAQSYSEEIGLKSIIEEQTIAKEKREIRLNQRIKEIEDQIEIEEKNIVQSKNLISSLTSNVAEEYEIN